MRPYRLNLVFAFIWYIFIMLIYALYGAIFLTDQWNIAGYFAGLRFAAVLIAVFLLVLYIVTRLQIIGKKILFYRQLDMPFRVKVPIYNIERIRHTRYIKFVSALFDKITVEYNNEFTRKDSFKINMNFFDPADIAELLVELKKQNSKIEFDEYCQNLVEQLPELQASRNAAWNKTRVRLAELKSSRVIKTALVTLLVGCLAIGAFVAYVTHYYP